VLIEGAVRAALTKQGAHRILHVVETIAEE
jgi:hypothetical protein